MAELRAICPSCGSITQSGRIDPKYYINIEKQVGFCHHCQFQGPVTEEMADNLDIVSAHEGKSFDQKSFESLEPLSEEAKRYLDRRFPGVEQAQLDAFQLRYSRKHHAIAIPLFNEMKQLQGIKYRLIANQDMRYSAEEGSQFGGYWIDGKTDKLLIVEGEFDAMSARVAGFEGTILALQTNRLSVESVKRVRGFKHVFLCLDSDSAGSEGSKSIQGLLHNPAEVRIEGDSKDLNELIQKEGIDAAHKFIQENTRTEIERSTKSFSDCIPEIITYFSDRRNTVGDPTGWRLLDEALGGGLRPCEMSVVNAFAKTGKTSFLNNVVHNLAASGKKVALASFEMDPARMLFPSLLSIAGQINIRAISDSNLLAESIAVLHKECSYLNNIITFRRFGYTPWSEVEEWATLMKERHQVEFLVLDHAGFMVEKMTDADENQELAKNIKKLTNTLGLHILVVVQAPKTKDGLSIQTSYGGMAWGQNADNFLILERDKQDESLLKVRLEASRYPGANPSNTPVMLFYDRETSTLLE